VTGRRHRHRQDTERDVRDELTLHRELRETDPTSPPAQSTASEAALVRLARSRDRHLRRMTIWHELRFDVVDSLRRLRRAPAFTLGTIGILAIGLGASVAVFGLANTMYLRTLPFANADRLVRVQETAHPDGPAGLVQWVDSSSPTLMATKASDAFAGAAGLRPSAAALMVPGAAARHIAIGEVGEGWSELIGLTPVMGRLFTPEEERQGAGAGVAVISSHLWQTHFGRRVDVLGQPLAFDGGARTVVGVLPDGFRFPYEEDAWWPQSFPPAGRDLFIYARLRPGVTLQQANARLAAVAPDLNRDWPAVIRGMIPQARLIRDVIVRDEGRVVALLGWSVAVLLIIVASNVAMLLTTRMLSRQRELELRAALGCGWGRQFRHLTLEAILVFVAGGIAGLGVAAFARRLLVAALPERMTTQLPMAQIAMDWRVVVFALSLALTTGLVFGAFSAWRTAGSASSAAGAGARTIGSRSGRRTAGVLIAVELALASALLAASVTVGGALRQIENRDLGFSTDGLLTLQFELAGDRLNSPGGHVRTLNLLEERLRVLPGIASVGTTTVNPLCCGDWGSRATPEGRVVRLEDAATVNWRLISPSFFTAMGIRTIAGRVFDAHDTETAEPVVVVDSRFAARFWPNDEAVGKRVKRGGTDSAFPWMRVVGVVSAVEDAGDYTESWYLPYLQYPAAGSSDQLHVMLRVSHAESATDMLAPIRRVVGEVDPALAIINLRTMDEIKMAALSQQRLGRSAAFIFAAIGGLLALSGVYGLVAFVVAGERRDMGIRMALGASAARVMRQVVGRIGRLALMGAIIGLTIAAMAERYVVAALGAKPDSFLMPAVAMTVLLLVAALLAAAIPARRVFTLDPREALNQ
jgi:predicted permease